MDPVHKLMKKCLEFKWTPSIMMYSMEWIMIDGAPIVTNEYEKKKLSKDNGILSSPLAVPW